MCPGPGDGLSGKTPGSCKMLTAGPVCHNNIWIVTVGVLVLRLPCGIPHDACWQLEPFEQLLDAVCLLLVGLHAGDGLQHKALHADCRLLRLP